MGQKPYGSKMIDHDGSSNIFYGRVVPYVDYSDHIFFNSGSVGIPAVMLIDLPFGSHHSQNDKLELLDPTQLKRISFLAAAAAYIIASAGPEESYKIIDEIYHCGKSRIEKEMKLAKSILHTTDKKNLVHFYQAAKNLIIHGLRRENKYAFAKYSPMHAYLYELFNLMDGQRNMLEIVQAVEAEALSSNYQTYSFEEILEFLQLLKEEEIITY